MNVSVVVCSYNPIEHYLARSLNAIAEQLPHGGATECILVDNRSEPSLADREIVRGRGIRVVREERPGLTAARARGAREALHELVVFVDDDNILAPDYLVQAIRLFADSRIAALSGCVVPAYESHPPRWFNRFEEAIAVRRLPAGHLHLTDRPRVTSYFPIGAGLCIRRDVLLRYFESTGLSERIEGRVGASLSSGEDIDLALAAIRDGYLVGSCSDLRLTHIIPPQRTTARYITALNRGSLRSCFQIDRKWRPVFGRPVFDYIDAPPWREAIKAVLFGLLALWPPLRVRSATHWELFRLLQARETAGGAQAA